MRINTWKEERTGSQRTQIVATWIDRMRRPGSVKLLVNVNESHLEHSTLIDGDPADVNDTLNNIAQIAWARGWRPVGLYDAVALTITKHARREG